MVSAVGRRVRAVEGRERVAALERWSGPKPHGGGRPAGLRITTGLTWGLCTFFLRSVRVPRLAMRRCMLAICLAWYAAVGSTARCARRFSLRRLPSSIDLGGLVKVRPFFRELRLLMRRAASRTSLNASISARSATMLALFGRV